jgi:predicted methyltransferase
MRDETTMRRRLCRSTVLLVLAAVGVVMGLGVLWDFLSTLDRLELVERERDRWQEPERILQALELPPDATVADLGCGAGYFTLKLARMVGDRGEVLAVDVRRLPLAVLAVRTRDIGNVRVRHVEPKDPELPAGSLDGVLIVNTYHELAEPDATLAAVHAALRPGRRLVVVERGSEHPEAIEHGHEHGSSAADVERDLERHGFTIVERRDPLARAPGDDASWWLVVALRP